MITVWRPPRTKISKKCLHSRICGWAEGAGEDFIPIRNRDGGSTPPSCRDWVANFDSEAPALTRTEHGASPWQPTSLRHLHSGWRRLPRRSTAVRRRAFTTCQATAWQAISCRRGSAATAAVPQAAGQSAPRECESPSAHFHAPVAQIIRAGGFEPPGCRSDSCRECHFQWACGLTRIAEGPDSESGSLGGASPFMPTNFTAPGLRGNGRPQRLKIAEPSGCKSRGADQPSLFELRLGGPACG